MEEDTRKATGKREHSKDLLMCPLESLSTDLQHVEKLLGLGKKKHQKGGGRKISIAHMKPRTVFIAIS